MAKETFSLDRPRYHDCPWFYELLGRVAVDSAAERLGHALLIHGVEGIGVDILASRLAELKLCETWRRQPYVDTEIPEPCGQCKSCRLQASGSHPDLYRLVPEGAAQIVKVDQIRALVSSMSRTPQISACKVALIYPAHRMNNNAANALLKLLEEPPGESLIILGTERPQLLPATIRSRCSMLKLRSPTATETRAFLLSLNLDEASIEQGLDSLGLKPFSIQESINSGSLQEYHQLAEQIERLEAGQETPSTLARQNKGMNPERMLNYLIKQVVLRRRSGKRVSMQQYLEFEAIYEAVTQARRALDAGVNPNMDLLLESIFIDWQRLGKQ